MIQSRFQIEMREGVKADLLFTLSLFGIAKRRGIELQIEDSGDVSQRLDFFVKLTYVAAINAWEYKRFDDPGIGDFPWTALDFAEWAGDNPRQFTKMITAASAAISGKEGFEIDGDDVKKK